MDVIPWWWRELPSEAIADCVEALENRRMTSGSVVRELEIQLAIALDFADVVVVDSGTSAIVASLLVAGVGPGDNVVVPALTWIATAQAAHLLGAEVRLADISSESLNLDLEAVNELADERTRAVIPVLFNGRSAGLEEIHAWASSKGIFVVEDRCKALGTTALGHAPLSLGSTAAFSMGMISHISVGYGGFVGCSTLSQAEQIRLIRDHGVIRENEHYERMGSNLKTSDFVAALALSQVQLLESSVANHVETERAYRDALLAVDSGLTHLGVGTVHGKDAGTYHECLLDEHLDFASVARACREMGVEVQGYHPSITKARYFGDYVCKNAERIAPRLLILPSGNTVDQRTVANVVPRIADAINAVQFKSNLNT
jgi:perosamine synthetase